MESELVGRDGNNYKKSKIDGDDYFVDAEENVYDSKFNVIRKL